MPELSENAEAPLLGPPPEVLERLLDEASPFVPPGQAFEGLSAREACRRVQGAEHSIADILAHLHFWQRYTLALARSEQPQMPQHAAEGWPPLDENGWEATHLAFLDGLTEMKRIAHEADLSHLVRGRETLGYELSLHIMHNAVHIGQVILLRRMIGAWPPPGGGDTW